MQLLQEQEEQESIRWLENEKEAVPQGGWEAEQGLGPDQFPKVHIILEDIPKSDISVEVEVAFEIPELIGA